MLSRDESHNIMKLSFQHRIIAILCLLIPAVCFAQGLCDGPYDGKRLSREEIVALIDAHKDPKTGINICGTHLSGIDLSDLNLKNANLTGADLTSAKLVNTNLTRANLKRTFLRWANCRKADLSFTNLRHAKLQESTLTEVNLHRANLELADLSGAQIQNADLSVVHAKYANFGFSDLSNTTLQSSYLYRANFEESNLKNANLRSTNLNSANFNNADTSYCNFSEADLTHADFINSSLKGANFYKAELQGVTYQPKLGSLPDIVMLATAKHFRSMDFNPSLGVSGLAELRTAYRDIGMRPMERKISAMLKYADMERAWERGSFGRLEAGLSYMLFYLTCDFGAQPSRPLKIFLAAILIFIFPYLFALAMPSRHSGIFVTWKSGRFTAWDKVARQSKQKVLIHLLKYRSFDTWQYKVREIFRTFRIACFFSLISSFQIGWSDLNLSTWISRMQAREYFLSSKGWVRFIAGFQSLLSAYLVVLWALCYFGRPFEW